MIIWYLHSTSKVNIMCKAFLFNNCFYLLLKIAFSQLTVKYWLKLKLDNDKKNELQFQ